MNPDPLPSDTTLRAPVGTGWLWVDDQLVVALASAPRPIVLDPVSSAIWEDLAGGRPVGEISAGWSVSTAPTRPGPRTSCGF